MMRLIDADRLKKETCHGVCSDCEDMYKGNNVQANCSEIRLHMLTLIDDQPTIEIVRCKDCEYFIQGKIHGLCDIHCNGAGECEVVKKDAFCSYGKRAEGKRRRMLDSGMVVKE